MMVQYQHAAGLGGHVIEDRPFVAEIDDHHVASGCVGRRFTVQPGVKFDIAVAKILTHGPRRSKPIGTIAMIDT
jgi:hypothetical protein